MNFSLKRAKMQQRRRNQMNVDKSCISMPNNLNSVLAIKVREREKIREIFSETVYSISRKSLDFTLKRVKMQRRRRNRMNVDKNRISMPNNLDFVLAKKSERKRERNYK